MCVLACARYCWRHQLQEFRKRFRVVALDMRGYNASGAPSGEKSYEIPLLVEDVREVIEMLGTKDKQGSVKAIVVGHDCGGVLAWVFTAQHPNLVEKLILMNTTHPSALIGDALSPRLLSIPPPVPRPSNNRAEAEAASAPPSSRSPSGWWGLVASQHKGSPHT
ncbi:epoxide hydrolase 4 [Alligator mississippiensis]|uniref:epoxide hydrolase 4 n=1 Tax=Alligator mississippiensis TaxID=8496 RepID=UPI002877C951|nr:epoxide hydrolase 4 [Alligator mississippiensis]